MQQRPILTHRDTYSFVSNGKIWSQTQTEMTGQSWKKNKHLIIHTYLTDFTVLKFAQALTIFFTWLGGSLPF